MIKNLIDIIQLRYRSAEGITFINGHEREDFLSYTELYDQALRVLYVLQHRNIRPKDELVLQVRDEKQFLIIFWACILGGIIPVPLSAVRNDEHRKKLCNIWGILNNPSLITARADFDKLYALPVEFEAVKRDMPGRSIFIEDIGISESHGTVHKPDENDIAFVQFSSGSTGDPKGVVLTHRNLISNLEGITEAANYAAHDSMLSWMPLSHDMGMIGFHLNPMYCGLHQYLIPVDLFVRQPAIWLDKATEYKASILCSPNFGYRYLLKHIKAAARNWDLSNVRIIYNGAEPISPDLCHEFNSVLREYNLKATAMCPVYGLAEASVAVSMSALSDEVRFLHLDRKKLKPGDQIAIKAPSARTTAFVNVGRPVRHCLLRIADQTNGYASDGVIGHIQIKGTNVTCGYYNNNHASQQVIDAEGWLKTGDAGFMLNGELYVTGRLKDIIFVNGQNYYPHDIEKEAESVEGVELNRIAVAGFLNRETHTEEIIVFLVHRGGLLKFLPVARSLRTHLSGKFGLEIKRIIPVKDIPKTTSGKLQRFRLSERYASGEFAQVEAELAELGQVFSNSDVKGPSSETEERILRMWKEVLHRDTIDVRDKFFEIGGDSLKAASLSMRFQREFEVDLPFDTLTRCQTIQQLAFEIGHLNRKPYKPIPKANAAPFYPVTSLQRRIYYAWKLDPSSVAYNMPVAFELKGVIDIERLSECLRQLVERHDVFRMTFHGVDRPEFKIAEKSKVDVGYFVCAKEKWTTMLREFIRPFDLEKGPLLRFSLLKCEQTSDHLLFLDFHHVVSDGQSVYYFVEELLRLYDGNPLPPLRTLYSDFAVWESRKGADSVRSSEAYWASCFADGIPVLELPTDHGRQVMPDGKGKRMEFEFDSTTTEKLNRLAGDLNVSLHAVIFTLYYILLSKYSGAEDIVIGIPVAGRKHPELERSQGLFVNSLPVRYKLDAHSTFAGAVRSAARIIEDALRHQDVSLDRMVSLVQAPHQAGRNPFFDTMLVYQSMHADKLKASDFELCRYSFDPGFSKFDITMEVYEASERIRYAFEYATSLFEDDSVLKLSGSFTEITSKALEDVRISITELSPLHASEHASFITSFNATQTGHKPFQTVCELFREQVEATPGAIAIEHNENQISYSELHEKASRMAAALVRKGVLRGDIVGVALPRSPELIIAILGILRAGGAFLPLESDLPAARIRYVLGDSRCKFVFAADQPEFLQPKEQAGPEVLSVAALMGNDRSDAPTTRSRPGDLAYVIYTSGTTGKPKGVMIPHKGLANYILWAKSQYAGREKATFPLYSSISFDLTITSIFLPLVTGNKMLIYDRDDTALLIEKVVREDRSNVVKLTPSHLRILRDHSLLSPHSAIRRFIVGGELLERQLALDIYKAMNGQIEIFNEYGPTEATVGCMIYKFNPEYDQRTSVPIGVPIDNTQIYLLDKYLKPVPACVPGELYISGDGLAKGYLFEETLTKQRFIDNPFITGGVMYRTGDIARRLPNGKLDFVGRCDGQVKVNGYRIELTEIEAYLNEHARIQASVVRIDEASANLYAYYTSSGKADVVEEGDLREYLSERLPYYMIPVRFIRLESIPLTKNGKVDTGLLPKPVASPRAMDKIRSDVEKISLTVWREVLGYQALGFDDNFFEFGGDSIKAVQISAKLYEKGISVKVTDILTYHTVEQACLHAKRGFQGHNAEEGVAAGEMLPTPVQSWFFQQHFKNPDYYNQSVLLAMKRPVDVLILQQTFSELIRHHDTLRLNVIPEKNVLFYNNRHLNEKFPVEKYELKADEALQDICNQVRGSFTLSDTLLIRACVLVKPCGKEYLFITAHHLIMDGVSWRILLNDLCQVYLQHLNVGIIKLPPKTASFKDWSAQLYSPDAWQQREQEAGFWTGIEDTHFTLPHDFNTHDLPGQLAGHVSAQLDAETTTYLTRDAHSTYNTDVAILLNAALALCLHQWTGAKEFVVEQEGHGRHSQELNLTRTIGWFTAMYPVKLVYKDEVGELIASVKEILRKVPLYGTGYGIDKYIANRIPHSGRRPEIRFNYLGQFGSEFDNEVLCWCNEPSGCESDPQNDLTARLELNCWVAGNRLWVEFNFDLKTFREATITRVSESFIRNVGMVLEHLKNEKDSFFTPSDFTVADLTESDLKVLFQS